MMVRPLGASARPGKPLPETVIDWPSAKGPEAMVTVGPLALATPAIETIIMPELATASAAPIRASRVILDMDTLPLLGGLGHRGSRRNHTTGPPTPGSSDQVRGSSTSPFSRSFEEFISS